MFNASLVLSTYSWLITVQTEELIDTILLSGSSFFLFFSFCLFVFFSSKCISLRLVRFIYFIISLFILLSILLVVCVCVLQPRKCKQ